MKELKGRDKKLPAVAETTSTGAGPGSSTMETGIGDAVPTAKAFKKKARKEDKEPKLAAGKIKNNYAVTHFGFTPAPSVPNRSSKAMDYKDLWEMEEAYNKSEIKTNAQELSRVQDYYNSATSSQKASAEDRLKKLKILVGLEKKHGIELPVLHYGEYWVDYLKKQGVADARELDSKLSAKKSTLEENYASFRNQTSKRSAPEQIHEAVKQIKKRLIEVNRLLEYTERLKTEVTEGTDDSFKYKTYTERALEQITEMIKQTYIKTKKLK